MIRMMQKVAGCIPRVLTSQYTSTVYQNVPSSLEPQQEVLLLLKSPSTQNTMPWEGKAASSFGYYKNGFVSYERTA